MDISHFIDMFLQLGLAGMFLIAFAEKFAPIFPSYVMLMLLGMTVRDNTLLILTIFATATGSLLGSTVWYGIGRALGGARVERAVTRFGKYVFLRVRTHNQ